MKRCIAGRQELQSSNGCRTGSRWRIWIMKSRLIWSALIEGGGEEDGGRCISPGIRRSLLTSLVALILAGAPAFAQNAPQCPMSGSPSDWGVNSIGYIEINSGGRCLFSLNVRGEILSSSVSQRPAHGRLQRIDRSSYVYSSKAGYRGSDTFSVRATGKGPYGAGVSVITINATLQ